jgi:hypothetical protein
MKSKIRFVLILSIFTISLVLMFQQSPAIAQSLEGGNFVGRYRTTGNESLDLFINLLTTGLTMAALAFSVVKISDPLSPRIVAFLPIIAVIAFYFGVHFL